MGARPLSVSEPASQGTRSLSSPERNARTVRGRAVEAAIWGMPIVSVDVMRQAFFRDTEAKYGDIIYWPSRPTGSSSSLPPTPQLVTYFNFNLQDSPVVLDVPPTVGAGLFGSARCPASSCRWRTPQRYGLGGNAGLFRAVPR